MLVAGGYINPVAYGGPFDDLGVFQRLPLTLVKTLAKNLQLPPNHHETIRNVYLDLVLPGLVAERLMTNT